MEVAVAMDDVQELARDTLKAILTQVRYQAADLMLHPRLDAIILAVHKATESEADNANKLSNWRIKL